jgi:CDP-diacylglycerol pyrophosphatase
MPLGLLLLAALFFVAWTWWQGRDTLWRIVDTSCIPAAASGGTGRCAEVSIPRQGPEAGHVVFKDRNGPLQYLLMPTRRVTGIEDPFLLTAAAPDYWGEAWKARRWMETTHGAPLPREAVSITLNSAWGRSQTHLHLHVSCVRDDLRERLREVPQGRSPSWAALPGGWQGHPYEVRRIVATALDGQDLFEDTARDHPGDMGRQALAAIGHRLDGQDGFWLLRTHLDLSAGWLASIEGDVQDHTCAVANRDGS